MSSTGANREMFVARAEPAATTSDADDAESLERVRSLMEQADAWEPTADFGNDQQESTPTTTSPSGGGGDA
jgi:hypothetical protein